MHCPECGYEELFKDGKRYPRLAENQFNVFYAEIAVTVLAINP